MKYISTRGNGGSKGFSEVVLEGLSRDGGLFVPSEVPDFSQRLDSLKSLSYQELALELFLPYVNDEIPRQDLLELINNSYSTFEAEEVTPLLFTEQGAILELFHGPTSAFKDVALQFLGNLFEYILKKDKRSLNILGATSGDTGSAAIHGVRGKAGIEIFMLHPKGKVSPVQEKQMTTVLDENVHNIAIEGTFDDAQRIIKEIFNDLDFRDQYTLGAVNSINWVRVMAQIVYYFYAAFRFQEKYPEEPLVFAVPTGNFGDIYAGYVARKMGLPIHKLLLATNENDILHRMVQHGDYTLGDVHGTISPSMDIQVSSNFERFLFDLVGQDGQEVANRMEAVQKDKGFQLSEAELQKTQEFFWGAKVDTKETLACIAKYAKSGIVLDPHTAVGVVAAERSEFSKVICLATAHPAKFKDAVVEATGQEPEVPAALVGITEKPSRCLEAAANYQEIERIIESQLN